MNLQLKGTVLNNDLLEAIDEQIGMYLIFIVNDEKLVVHYKEPLEIPRGNRKFIIKKRFETSDAQTIELYGATLDKVYKNLVRNTSNDLVKVQNIAKSIEVTEEIVKLTKKLERLKKKMYPENSMRKQIELKQEWKRVNEEIEALKCKKDTD